MYVYVQFFAILRCQSFFFFFKGFISQRESQVSFNHDFVSIAGNFLKTNVIGSNFEVTKIQLV